MINSKLLDTFPDFLQFWEKEKNAPLAAQITAWQTTYMSQWPELLEKQLNDYAEMGEDWQKTAGERSGRLVAVVH